MLRTEYSLFLGKASEQVFSGFISENGLYLVVEIEGTSNEVGNSFLTHVKADMERSVIRSLSDFESLISQSVHKANLPLGVSIAASYVQNGMAFLLTLGEGKILLQRGKDQAEIIQGNNTASGPVQENDLYILATERFSKLFSSPEQFKKIIGESDVFSVVDTIYEKLGEVDDKGVTTLFFSPVEVEDEIPVQSENVIIEEGEKTNIIASEEGGVKFPKLPFSRPSFGAAGPKRILTLAIVVVIFGVLIWSVVLGYQRRSEAQLSEKIQTTKQSISTKLDEAQTEYDTNASHALELIAEAKKEIADLKNVVGTKKPDQLSELEKLVSDREDQITKKSEITAEEFYDLSLDTKNASAKSIFISGDTAELMDKSNKTIYLVSLSQKSLNKRTSSEIGSATLVSYYQDTVYFFVPDRGVYTIAEGNKVKKIIDADKDWGEITDMKVYSGNIYLLDTGKNDISKYLVTDSGYSSKQSYFKANASVSSAHSMAIDSAVYISFPDKVLKYNGGLPTDFNTSYPDGSVSIEKVVTDDTLQKVFVWNKNAGTVYVLEKTGGYNQQIQSSIMKTASDFFATSDNLFFLSGSKIYRVKI